jgi:hypothetical protein
MQEKNYLSLQASIICLLLALIGATVVVKHSDWFGGLPKGVAPTLDFIAPQAN